MKQHRFKIALAAGILFFIWWLWPSQNAEKPGRAVAISDQSSADAVVPVSSLSVDAEAERSSADRANADGAIEASGKKYPSKRDLSKKDREDLARRFAEVNKLIDNDQTDSAEVELKALIEEFPSVIEPYINLAALQSKSNQLEQARQTLNSGIEANQNTSLLFESRQRVLGVQAARAYQQALNEPVDTSESVLLPLISSIEVPISTASTASTKRLQAELTRLNGLLSDAQLERSKLEEIRKGLEQDKSELLQANGKLELERNSFKKNETSFAQFKADFEQDKKGLAQANSDLKQANSELSKGKEALEIEKKSLVQSAKSLSEEKRVLERDKATLADTVEALRKSNSDLLAQTKVLEAAQADLTKARDEADDSQVSDVSNEAVAQAQALTKAQAAEIKELKKELAANRVALKESQQLAAKTRTELDQSETEIARLRQQVEDQPVVARVDAKLNTSESPATTTASELTRKPDTKQRDSDSDVAVGQQLQRVIERVKSWAADWSAQDVSGYVSHYADNYAPSRGSLTHQQWLEQREIRLTNKSFINVDVSDFQGQRRGDKLVVTFSQHYRSNTVDDRIVKRLVFAKNDLDWSNAKIVDEVVVSR